MRICDFTPILIYSKQIRPIVKPKQNNILVSYSKKIIELVILSIESDMKYLDRDRYKVLISYKTIKYLISIK